MYLQFLGFGVLLHSVRKQWPQAAMAFGLGCLAMAAFLLMNVPTIGYSLQHGSNLVAGVRSLNDLELYGLKVPDLFMPPPYHRWHWWASFGQSKYYIVTALKGESWSPYLGFVGIAGLAWLAGMSIFRLFQGKPRCIPVQAWQTLWVLAFSIVGGANLILGILGCNYFRASNRYSIIILCISLFFLVRQLSRHCPRRLALPVTFVLLAAGLADQLPPVTTTASIEQVAQQIRSDREFTAGMESGLPPGTMVFQLPVVGFPESPPINKMYDYEHFIPYFYSKLLRYSYGSDKGRALDAWQREVEKMPPAEMAAKLEEYGFGAIYLNTKAFKDGGSKLIDDLRDAGKPVFIVSSRNDLVAIRLTPAAVPSSPDIPPFFGPGWSEGGHGPGRWAVAREATIELWNTQKESTRTSIQFGLVALKPRHVRISFNSGLFDDFDLQPNAVRLIGPKHVTLAPGKNIMRFETDMPPDVLGKVIPPQATFWMGGLKEARFTTGSGFDK
jgi:phosphoglycerol transferase